MAADPTLIEQLKAALEPREEILEAYLFGSMARGDSGPLSDVDVAVYVEAEPPTRWGYDSELASDLMGVLGRNDVEVVILNRAPPLLYHRVLRDGIRLFSRDLVATTRRAGWAVSRYLDFKVQLAKADAAFRRRMERGDFGR